MLRDPWRVPFGLPLGEGGGETPLHECVETPPDCTDEAHPRGVRETRGDACGWGMASKNTEPREAKGGGCSLRSPTWWSRVPFTKTGTPDHGQPSGRMPVTQWYTLSLTNIAMWSRWAWCGVVWAELSSGSL